MKYVYVVKANGQEEAFSEEKVFDSAVRAGASEELADEITESIAGQAYPGIQTSEIFSQIKKELKEKNTGVSLRFNLKDGIKKLGPTGFPFEKFIGDVLSVIGYEVKINQYLPGKCLDKYEIDFVARKNNKIYIGECKYRNLAGEKIHLTDALANFARFEDIKNGTFLKKEKNEGFQFKSILVTNTKFTGNATRYSNCSGVDLLGWRQPKGKGLANIIEEHQLYPITILPLKSYIKDILVEHKIMLVKELLEVDAIKFSQKNKIPLSQLTSLISNAKLILG